MDHIASQQPPLAAPVFYAPDGTPYYAAPTPLTAPLALYQPPAPQPIPAQHATPAVVYLPQQPQALSPVPGPVRDPWPARLVAGGVALGAGGLGIGFAAQAVAAAVGSVGGLAALGVGAYCLAKTTGGNGGSRGGQGAVNVNVTVSNRNR